MEMKVQRPSGLFPVQVRYERTDVISIEYLEKLRAIYIPRDWSTGPRRNVEAIKELRTTYGMGLKDAKDLIEFLAEEFGWGGSSGMYTS